jgi:hypothetical protein
MLLSEENLWMKLTVIMFWHLEALTSYAYSFSVFEWHLWVKILFTQALAAAHQLRACGKLNTSHDRIGGENFKDKMYSIWSMFNLNLFKSSAIVSVSWISYKSFRNLKF